MKPDFPRGDLHIHSIYSDGCTTLEGIIQIALKKGLTVISKADHNTCRGNHKLAILCREKGLLFIPAIEVSSKEGHIVVAGVDHWVKESFTAEETAEKAHDLGGIAILAHPYYKGSQRDRAFLKKGIDAIELLNGASPFGNIHTLRRLHRLPIRPGLSLMVGSDSHSGYLFGDYLNFFKCDLVRDDVLEAIRKGRVKFTAPLLPLKGWFVDGAPNQVYQLKRLILYRKTRPRTEFDRQSSTVILK